MSRDRGYAPVLLAVLLGFLALVPSAAQAEGACRARSAVAVDVATGEVLVGKDAKAASPPASTAKLVTALVVLDHLPLSRRVAVSRRAELQPPSEVGLRAGESWSVRDLLYALLLESGNDAAAALAEAAAGSEAAFAQRMTRKAHALGAGRTTFGNASGLPHPVNRTCAADLATLATAAYRNPVLRKILETKQATITSRAGRAVALKNHNKLLWDVRFDVLGKTGYTRASQKCFAGVYEDGPRRIAVAILGSRDLWGDLRSLLSRSARSASSGAELSVRSAQERLKAAGYDPGPVDGILGPRTRSALTRFQRDRKLDASGRIDAATSDLLRGSSAR